MSILNPDAKPDDPFIMKMINEKGPPDSYFEDEYKMLNSSRRDKGTVYDEAMKLEIRGAYDIEKYSPERQLSLIANELRINSKVNAIVAFKFGKLLHLAKLACREGHVSFQNWVTANFQSSYKTAHNYMNLYKNCLGMMSIAVKIPLSVLEKIAAPSFPAELREFLFTQANIEKFTYIDLKSLLTRYKEGGFEAIAGTIEQWNRDYLVYRQTNFMLDRFRGILLEMTQLNHKVNDSLKSDKDSNVPVNQKPLPETKRLYKRLANALRKGISDFERVMDESDTILNALIVEAEGGLKS